MSSRGADCIFAGAILSLLTACSSGQSSSGVGLNIAPTFTPLIQTAFAIPGKALVTPRSPIAGGDPTGRMMDVRLGDAAARGIVHRFEVTNSNRHEWLATARSWAPAGTGATTTESKQTVDLLVVETPEQGLGDLTIDGERIQLDWRDPPDLDATSLFALSAVPEELRTPLGQSALFQMVSPALDDPTERWRIRLLADRLRVAGLDILADRLSSPVFEHPALESLATMNELQWRLGLDRLTNADPLLAREVASALTRISTVHGVVRPTWTPGVVVSAAGSVDQLRRDLLDAQLSVSAMLARVDAWLDTQPRAVAWVIDDAGAADPGGGLALARAGIVDLAGRGGVARAAISEDRPGPGVTIAPLGGGTIVASATLPVRTRLMSVTLGEWSAQRPVVAGSLEARPPGVQLAPLLKPWNLATWLTGTPASADAAMATAGILTRRSDGAWELRIECRIPSRDIPPGDVVRVFLGSARQPRAVLRLDPRGFMYDELEPVAADESPTRTPLVVRRQDDRWACSIVVPDSAIEPGMLLRIGIERRTDSGDRLTWPRPVLPEQDQPGRALIDLGAWFGFRGAPAR